MHKGIDSSKKDPLNRAPEEENRGSEAEVPKTRKRHFEELFVKLEIITVFYSSNLGII